MIFSLFWQRSSILICIVCLSPYLIAPSHASSCTNDTFNRILERNVLTVGLKADYKPWGFKNEDGEIIGLEADLALEVANTLGVALQTVEVSSSDRIQNLESGEIDLLIATMSDRADRRKLVGVALPNYYTSGTNVMAKDSQALADWANLKDQKVCGKQGAFYNKMVEERYGADVIAFNSVEEAKHALRQNECIAWVYDDSSIMSDLASGDWDGYTMPLNSEDSNPWGIAVPLQERECILGQLVSGLQYNWHASGKLIELEKKWGIQATEFLRKQHSRFSDWLME